MPHQLEYRSDIDGLRGIAVLLVFLYHSGVPGFAFGYVGVDIFFVISGYLITTLLLRDIERKQLNLKDFYARRVRRIIPALLIVVLTCCVLAWWVLMPVAFHDFAQSLVATSAMMSNVLFWLESSYFAPTSELKPLLHTWSLAVEEQHYLVFPILLLLVSR